MNKILIIALALFYIPFKAQAQFNIKGRLCDDKNIDVDNASLFLYGKKENTLLHSAISDEHGNFLLVSKSMSLTKIVVNAVGFATDTINLGVISSDTSIIIKLKPIAQQLQEVSISLRRPLIERKLDRLVFNIENSLVSDIGDAMDAIAKAPGLRVNDDGIQIIGKNVVRIMINNRLLQLSGTNLINYLRSISSSTLKSIEVITNPSSKYEADGNSGILNIIVKKDQSLGFNGMINIGTILASYHNTGITGSLSYNTKKMHINGTVSSYLNKSVSFSNLNVKNQYLTWDRYDEELSNRKGGRAEVRIDYNLSKSTVMGLRYGENHNVNNVDNNSRGDFYGLNPNLKDSVLLRTGRNEVPLSNRSADLYLESKLDTLGKKIEISTNYFNNSLSNTTFFRNSSQNANKTTLNEYIPVDFNNNEHTRVFSMKIDLALPYKFVNVETGVKIAAIRSVSSLRYDQGSILDLSNNNVFQYNENTQSLYLNANKSLKDWSVQIGLRIENTQTIGNSSTKNHNDKYNYAAFFPSFYLKNAISENHALFLSYGKRINRPDYEVLNPARIYSAINIYDQGNPSLRPSFSNNFELGHNYKDLLTSTIYTGFLNNGFSMLTFLDGSNILSTQYWNYSNTIQLGWSETISVPVEKWWENTTKINVYYYHSRSNGALLESGLKGLSSYLSTDNTLMINKVKTLMANFKFWYQFPDQSNWYKSNDYFALDINFRAAFTKRSLIVTAGVVDLFKTSQRSYTGTINAINQYSTLYNDNRKFRLMLMYRIGNDRANKRARLIDDAEINRVRQ